MNKLVEKLVDEAKSCWNDYGKFFIASLSLVASAASLYAITTLTSPHMLRISFLDVGQGDAIFIQTPNGRDMLIDGGPTSDTLARLSDRMSYFDRDIDVIIATHDDADHVTGLIPVLQKFDVGMVVASPVASDTSLASDLRRHIEEEGGERYVGEKGDVIDFGDGVLVHILYPNKNISPKTETNDASVSAVIIYGDHSFLLTGDLSSKRERNILSDSLPRNVTVYKAGHHGSKTSSGVELLTYIKPEYAVISAGKDNRYGHPNPEALERLDKYSKEILSTIDRGTITFASDGRTLNVETEK